MVKRGSQVRMKKELSKKRTCWVWWKSNRHSIVPVIQHEKTSNMKQKSNLCQCQDFLRQWVGKIFIYCLVLLLGVVTIVASPLPAFASTVNLCANDNFITNPANGHRYCLTAADTWTASEAEAVAKGGNLVTINDQAEQDWLLQTFGNTDRLWIGSNDAKVEESFVWSSGENSNYTNWLPGEPNNGQCNANEDYTVMNWSSTTGGWNDLNEEGFWQDCKANSSFCRLEGTAQGIPSGCKPGLIPLPGIVEIPTPPIIYNGTINGVKWNDLNGDGVRDSIIKGDKPDVVMVMDLSWSTILDKFQGSPVGDVNKDGSPNDILDAQLAGFIALNQQLIDQGLGDTARVGIVVFSINGYQVDMDRVTPGKQLVINPTTDKNGNGVSDVEEILTQVKVSRNFPGGPYQAYVDQVPTNLGGCYVSFPCRGPGGGTNFEPGLALAKNTFQAVSTPDGEANIIFLSDGVPGGGSEPQPRTFQVYQNNYLDEVSQLKAIDANISAFGVGQGASLGSLQKIDEKATVFSTTDDLLSVFSGLDSGKSSSTTSGGVEPGLSGVTVYLDLNNNGILDNNEPIQVTDDRGVYHFTSLEPGIYVVREVLPGSFKQTAPQDGFVRITLGENETANNVNFGNLKQ